MWARMTDDELKDLAEGDAELLVTLTEAENVWENVLKQAQEGDVDDLLAACRDFIIFHIEDTDKFMKGN